MSDFRVKDIDLSGIERKLSGPAAKAAQTAFAQRVALDMRKHVPVEEGTLRDSEPLNSDYADGRLVWNTPYARRIYNADSVRTAINPYAAPHWAEVTKAEKLENWKGFAAALVTGGGASVEVAR